MGQGRTAGTVGRVLTAAALLAVLAVASACNRDPPRMTECQGNRPAAERTKDTAPPNCEPALPGTQPEALPAETAPAAAG